VSDLLTALFVRVPEPLANRLDERSRDLGRSKQSVVTEMLDQQLAQDVGKRGDDGILNLAETAELLRIAPSDVLNRVEHSNFPGRRFGDEWRFAKSAVVAWLGGNDSLVDHPTGF
jgi:predicted DNA-binding protein